MIAKRLKTSLMAASAVALCAGGAHAGTTYTLDLSGSGGVFSNPNRYDVQVTGFPTDPPVTIQAGDEVIVNFTITDGPITMPAGTQLQLFNFFLSGDGFAVGDSATHGTDTIFDGATQLAQNTFNTTTSNGIGSLFILFGSVPAITFDSITTDIMVDAIGVDHVTGIPTPGATGTLGFGSFNAETRNVAAAAPEPASWALMLLGFGGLGAVLRRRRAQPALA